MPVVSNPNRALVFILITVLIDVLGFGIIIPVVPHLISELLELDPLGDGTLARAATWGGILLFVYALMQFLFSPVLGNLSDRYGRRPILLLSMLGLAADNLFMAFAPTIGWLVVGRMVAGLLGASLVTAAAYVADISPKELRSRNFGFVGATVGVGFIVGPVLGGWLGELGPRMPFFAGAGFAALNLVYGYFVLPESLSRRKRRRFDVKRANPLGTVFALSKHPFILPFLTSMFLFTLAFQVFPSIWNFFTIEKFEWSTGQIGISLGVFGAMVAVVQGLLVSPLIKLLGGIYLMIAGLIFAGMGFFGLSLIETPFGLYGYLIPSALAFIFVPGINGIMANRVPDNAQGELQGAITAVNSISAILGPLTATWLFAFFTSSGSGPDHYPGAPFMAGGVMILCALALVIWIAGRLKASGIHIGPDRTAPKPAEAAAKEDV